MIKLYFHIVYGGGRRRYEGARRNSLRNDRLLSQEWKLQKVFFMSEPTYMVLVKL